MTIFFAFRKALLRLSSGNADVLGAILLSAVLLILIRCLCPLLVLLDEGSQIEAAQNLVAGHGLISRFSTVPIDNLTMNPKPGILTWWPPGFSFLLSGFLYLKFPLAASLKIIYSLTTMLGWLGWGMIASYLLAKPIFFKSRKIYLNLAAACLIPLFYTPRWVNTDIFLWAGLPFIVLLLSRWGQNNKEKYYQYTSIAGIIIGLLYFLRYASLSILVGSILLLILLNLTSLRRMIFGIGLLMANFSLLFLPVYVYNKVAGNNIGLPEYISPGTQLFSFDYMFGILGEIYSLLSLFGYPFLPRPGLTPISALNALFASYPWVRGILFLISCLVLFGIPIAAFIKLYRKRSFDDGSSIAFSIYFYLLITSGFLFITSFLFEFNFFGNPRYYIPFLCVLILLFYHFISNTDLFSRWGRRLVVLYLVSVLSTNIVLPSVFFLATSSPLFKGATRSTIYFEKLLLGYKLSPDSPTDDPFITNFEDSAPYLDQLIQDNQDALFYIQYPSAYFDTAFREQLRPIPLENFWESAYVEQPTQAYFIMLSDSCPSICSSYLPDKPIETLMSLRDLEFQQDIYEKYRLKLYRGTIE